jgi:hypothetical protein
MTLTNVSFPDVLDVANNAINSLSVVESSARGGVIGKVAPKLNAAAGKDSDDILYVRDKLSVHGTRVHQFSNGTPNLINVSFSGSDDWKQVPRDYALSLISIDGFEVAKNPGGTPIRAEVKKDISVDIASDEVIARFTELTRESLLNRATGVLGNKAPKGMATFTKQQLVDILLKYTSDHADHYNGRIMIGYSRDYAGDGSLDDEGVGNIFLEDEDGEY